MLFVVFPEPGHVNPIIPVMQRLRRDGHVVAVFAYDDVNARLRRANLPIASYFVDEEVARTTHGRPARTRALAKRLKDPRWRSRWIQHTLVDVVPRQIEALRLIIEATHPDVLCVDPLNYAGGITAERLGLPWAGIATNLLALAPADYRDALRSARPEIDAEFAELAGREAARIGFRFAETVSPYLNTVFTTEAFVPRSLSGNIHSHLVGPTFPLGQRGDETPFPWEKLRGDLPIIYVSFGGGGQLSFAPKLFQTLTEAVPPDEAQMVLALGELVNEPFVRTLPEHVLRVGYAPQLELLKRVSVMVSHGGANSVMECLAQGKPLLVLPLDHEQPLQGTFVERCGAGYARDPDRLEVEDCRAILRSLIAKDSSYRQSAQRIAASYAQNDGAERVAQLVVELAEKRAPIMPPLQ